MYNKVVGASIVIAILLTGCSIGEKAAPPPIEISKPASNVVEEAHYEPVDASGGLYVYYNQAIPHNETTKYGLMNRKGEFVLPLQPNGIYALGSAQEQYFIMSTKHISSNYTHSYTCELISPSGKILTNAGFQSISPTEDPNRFVGLAYGGQVMWIDENGNISECDDETVKDVTLFNYKENSQIGYDIPEFFAGGTDSDPNRWDAVIPNIADGDVIYATQCNIIRHDCYIVNLKICPQGDYSKSYYISAVCNSERKLLIPETFPAMRYAFPYIIGIRENETVVYDSRTLKEVCRYPEAPDNTRISPEWEYMVYNGGILLKAAYEPVRITDIMTGEQFVFKEYPLTGLYAVSGDGQVFLFFDQEGYYYAFTRQGRLLYKSDSSDGHKYQLLKGDYIITQRIVLERNDYPQILYGLMALDGQEVLAPEFSYVEVLDQDLFLVVRGDYSGVMDAEGNWIYKEAIYQYLDD